MTLVCRYIHLRDAARYEADGWKVTLCPAHHGQRGYCVASKRESRRPDARGDTHA